MTKEEMEELGIKAYGLRKRLLRVIQSQEGHNDSAQVQQTQVQQVHHQVQVWHDSVSSQDNLYRAPLVLPTVLPRTHRGGFM